MLHRALLKSHVVDKGVRTLIALAGLAVINLGYVHANGEAPGERCGDPLKTDLPDWICDKNRRVSMSFLDASGALIDFVDGHFTVSKMLTGSADADLESLEIISDVLPSIKKIVCENQPESLPRRLEVPTQDQAVQYEIDLPLQRVLFSEQNRIGWRLNGGEAFVQFRKYCD
jgi:hypothetical protein